MPLSLLSHQLCPSAEVQAIASLIEKQAQIVVKQKEVSVEEKRDKQALLQQYANVTDDEEYPFMYCPAFSPEDVAKNLFFFEPRCRLLFLLVFYSVCYFFLNVC